MKKVIEIRDLFGHKLPIDKMDILFTGKDYVMARYKGFGFTKVYAPYDGYTVIFAEN